MKNHYDNLKVARNAPQEVIRAAYKSLCQKYHPDRNNNSEESIRIMKIINESYDVLSDPDKRKKHDEWIFRQENVGNEQKTKSEENDSAASNFYPPNSGYCIYDELNDEEKTNLSERISGKNKNQFAIQLTGVKLNYLWVFMLLGWFVYLFIDANEYRWAEETIYWHMGFTALSAVLLGNNINRIYSWHKTHLQSWLIVTPLYVIKTHLDEIWFWPIWAVSDIKATHNYKNGSYQGTSLIIAFDGKNESFTISPKSAYESLLGALDKYNVLFRNAINNKNLKYLIENDDFINIRHEKDLNKTSKPKREQPVYIIYGSVLLVSAMLFFMAGELNSHLHYKQVFHAQESPKYNPKPNIKPVYIRPSAAPNGSPWPQFANYVSGYAKLNTDGLSSVTVDNSKNDSDVFVKLVRIEENESYPARVFYIPSHRKFMVENVTSGKYDIRYKDLNSGALSKSEIFTLEEVKTHDGTNYSQITMTLYKVMNGNMQTYGISENEF